MYVIAIAKGSEEYDTVKLLFEDLNTGLKSMIKNNSWSITIENKEIELDFVFVSDMKFMLLATGSPAANGKQTCMCCMACKHNRHHWDRSHGIRNLNEYFIGKEGQKREPAIILPVENIMIDELHLVLRLGDTLLTRFVKLCLKDLKIKPSDLINEFQRVHLNLRWSPSSDTRDEIRLNSYKKWQHLRWFQKLEPANLRAMNPAVANQWMRVMATFITLYSGIVSSPTLPPKEIEMLADGFLQLLLEPFAMSSTQTISLFQPEEVTPYMHVLCHLPSMVSRYGSLKPFSCSSLERKNLVHASQVFSLTKRGEQSSKDLMEMELIVRAIKPRLLLRQLIKTKEPSSSKPLDSSVVIQYQSLAHRALPTVAGKPQEICSECQQALSDHSPLSQRKLRGWIDTAADTNALLAIETCIVDITNLLLGVNNDPMSADDVNEIENYLSILCGDEKDEKEDDKLFLQSVMDAELAAFSDSFPSLDQRKVSYENEKVHRKEMEKEKRKQRAQAKVKPANTQKQAQPINSNPIVPSKKRKDPASVQKRITTRERCKRKK